MYDYNPHTVVILSLLLENVLNFWYWCFRRGCVYDSHRATERNIKDRLHFLCCLTYIRQHQYQNIHIFNFIFPAKTLRKHYFLWISIASLWNSPLGALDRIGSGGKRKSSSSGIFSAAINAQCALHIVHYNTLHYSAMQNITPLNVYLQCRTSVNMKNTKCEILFYTDYPCSWPSCIPRSWLIFNALKDFLCV